MAIKDSKIEIELENGMKALAQAPIIVSASRSTDIPAFYCDWFLHRLKVGYSAWTNPFNGVKMYVSYSKTRFIVFWSKNPRPLIDSGMLDYLHEKGIKCYVQYSLNDYEDERLEKGVKPLEYRIETFKLLYDILGRGGVVWRFDPLMLTADINVDKLLKKIENIGEQLKGFTEKLVFSFADITTYKKVKKNLDDNRIPWRDWTHEEMNEFARNLVELNKSKEWGYELATCGEKGRYPGIVPNHCVDDALIIRRGCEDQELMNFLKAEIHLIPQADLFGNVPSLPENAIILDDGRYVTRGDNRDKGQRDFCGCMKSKDIGQYNTCIHMCEYCYANTSKETAASNYKCHRNHPYSDTITGK